MNKVLSPDDRRRLAALVNVNPATLYQAMTAKNFGFSPAECVRIERESLQELRRWDLRPKDWHLIWPELIGADGAPELPEAERIGE
jgi:DNA-binding transcriptional regulator YdaS (Cro superfamily)